MLHLFFAAAVACAPAGFDRDALTDWKAAGFAAPAENRAAFVTGLADCLGDPDPAIRDGVAFEGLAAMLRAGAVPDSDKQALLGKLLAMLGEPDDPDGFARPFAALVLAEVARADRIARFLSDAEYRGLVEAGVSYVSGVDDYRGFSETEGWRHGVAHGADLLMQLALNPRTDAAQLGAIIDAVAAQAAPSSHAYVFGEGERLARPLLFAAMHPNNPVTDWSAALARSVSPAPLASWNEAFASESALRRLHNLKAFLQAVYINASLSDNAKLKPLAETSLGALKTLP